MIKNDIRSQQVGGDHYKDFEISPAEFLCKNKVPFLEGCVIKRMLRHSKKNGAEDLRKAIHEIEMILAFSYGDAPSFELDLSAWGPPVIDVLTSLVDDGHTRHGKDEV